MKLTNAKMNTFYHQNRSSTNDTNSQVQHQSQEIQLSSKLSEALNSDIKPNPTTPVSTYDENDSSTENLSLTSGSSKISNQNDTFIQEPNIESTIESEIDIIQMNNDLSNLDEILNSNECALNNNNKHFEKSGLPTCITVPNLHTIQLLNDEDFSEENWGNILMNPKKKRPKYLTKNREILMRNLDSKSKTKSIGLL